MTHGREFNVAIFISLPNTEENTIKFFFSFSFRCIQYYFYVQWVRAIYGGDIAKEVDTQCLGVFIWVMNLLRNVTSVPHVSLEMEIFWLFLFLEYWLTSSWIKFFNVRQKVTPFRHKILVYPRIYIFTALLPAYCEVMFFFSRCAICFCVDENKKTNNWCEMNLQSYVYRAYIQWQSKLSKSAIYNGNLLVTYARTSSHIQKNVQSRTHTQIKKKLKYMGKIIET